MTIFCLENFHFKLFWTHRMRLECNFPIFWHILKRKIASTHQLYDVFRPVPTAESRWNQIAYLSTALRQLMLNVGFGRPCAGPDSCSTFLSTKHDHFVHYITSVVIKLFVKNMEFSLEFSFVSFEEKSRLNRYAIEISTIEETNKYTFSHQISLIKKRVSSTDFSLEITNSIGIFVFFSHHPKN